jgi:hypothetical protein
VESHVKRQSIKSKVWQMWIIVCRHASLCKLY